MLLRRSFVPFALLAEALAPDARRHGDGAQPDMPKPLDQFAAVR
jgi:hypothetical protein